MALTHEQRTHYRIFYKAPHFPMLVCEQGKFAIHDVSETGMCAQLKAGPFRVGDSIEGKLIFPAKRGEVVVKGMVIRVEKGHVAIKFSPDGQIPLARILDEQRTLIKKGDL